MKQIKLLKLTLQNFKGIKDFSFSPNGESVTVTGKNGSGKTSLADGLNWLLFDKDSHGNKDFQIKPLESGREVHGIETKVEAILQVDGEPMSITKAFKEVWRKKRGSKDKEFEGHTTEYFIDDVPLKKSEFQQRMAEICDERTFRLLTSVTYFNAVLHWQDRRGVVIDVCGDVSMFDVVGKTSGLDSLPDILGKHSVDDFLKMTKSQRKEANKSLGELPVRIDEAENSKPERPGLTLGIDHLRKDLKALQDRRAAILAGDNKHLRDKIADLEMQKKNIEGRNEQAEEKLKSLIKGLEVKRDGFLADNEKAEKEVEGLDKQISDNKKTLDELRAEYRMIVAEEWGGDGTCATCGQPLPEAMLAQAKANFNSSKADRQAKNQSTGKELAQKNKAFEERKSGLVDRVAVLDQEIDIINEKIKNRPEMKKGSAALVISQIAEIQQKIDVAAGTPDTQEIDAEILRFEENIADAEQRKAAMSQIESIDKRIVELKAEQKGIAALIETYDKHIYLCEEYTKARVSMLEGLVADKFAPHSFKMFDVQVNGGISETCELLRDGKPYSALSTGEKIAAGLHVIEVLSEHYGIACPVFIDNAESITLPVKTDQMQQVFLKAVDGVVGLITKKGE